MEINWLEIIGFASGVICVYLAARQNIWNWPVAMVSVGVYAVVFYMHKLYGDMLLQLYFAAMNGVGWYRWSRKQNNGKILTVTYCTAWQRILIIAGTAFLTGFLTGFLKAYTDSDVPLVDAITTAMSIVAQILLSYKKIENWIIWILADVIYIGLYIYKALYLTAVLYLILTLIACFAYVNWQKITKTSTYE